MPKQVRDALICNAWTCQHDRLPAWSHHLVNIGIMASMTAILPTRQDKFKQSRQRPPEHRKVLSPSGSPHFIFNCTPRSGHAKDRAAGCTTWLALTVKIAYPSGASLAWAQPTSLTTWTLGFLTAPLASCLCHYSTVSVIATMKPIYKLEHNKRVCLGKNRNSCWIMKKDFYRHLMIFAQERCPVPLT